MRQFPPTKGLLLKRDINVNIFNSAKLENLILDGTSWLRKTRRDWHGASSKLGTCILCDIRLLRSRYHGLEKTPIPISKVKYGSYPSKNIPYFIHLLSLHVFYRISGRTLPNAVFALPIGGVPPIRMKSMLWNLYMAELLESYITCPETYPL